MADTSDTNMSSLPQGGDAGTVGGLSAATDAGAPAPAPYSDPYSSRYAPALRSLEAVNAAQAKATATAQKASSLAQASIQTHQVASSLAQQAQRQQDQHLATFGSQAQPSSGLQPPGASTGVSAPGSLPAGGQSPAVPPVVRPQGSLPSAPAARPMPAGVSPNSSFQAPPSPTTAAASQPTAQPEAGAGKIDINKNFTKDGKWIADPDSDLVNHLDDNHDQKAMDNIDDHYQKLPGGLTAAQKYDKAVNEGFIKPPDQDLTKRQKSQLFLEFGLALLAHSDARTDTTASAFGKAGQETQATYQNLTHNIPVQSALADYERRQKIELEAAGKQADLEKQAMVTRAEQLRADTAAQQAWARANLRNDTTRTDAANRIAEEDRRTAAERNKPDQPQEIQNPNGPGTVMAVIQRDANGNPTGYKVLPNAGGKSNAARDDKDDAARTKAIAADVAKRRASVQQSFKPAEKNPDGSIKTPGRPYTDDELTQMAADSYDKASGKKPVVSGDPNAPWNNR
jgi:hypothetical protein